LVRCAEDQRGFLARHHSPSPDGQRFLVNAYGADPQPLLDVLVNWPASLKK